MSYNNAAIHVQTPCKGSDAYWDASFAPARAQILVVGATNGSLINKLAATSASTALPTIHPFIARLVTGPSIATGAVTASNPQTITRASGSFVTDGWQVGDLCLVYNPTTLTNMLIDRVTVVAALTLTLTGNAQFSAESLPAGAALYRVFPRGAIALVAGTPTLPTMTNLLTNAVLPGVLSDANAQYYVPASVLFGVKPSATTIINNASPLTAATYLNVGCEYDDL